MLEALCVYYSRDYQGRGRCIFPLRPGGNWRETEPQRAQIGVVFADRAEQVPGEGSTAFCRSYRTSEEPSKAIALLQESTSLASPFGNIFLERMADNELLLVNILNERIYRDLAVAKSQKNCQSNPDSPRI